MSSIAYRITYAILSVVVWTWGCAYVAHLLPDFQGQWWAPPMSLTMFIGGFAVYSVVAFWPEKTS